jgi:hypothetical protein
MQSEQRGRETLRGAFWNAAQRERYIYKTYAHKTGKNGEKRERKEKKERERRVERRGRKEVRKKWVKVILCKVRERKRETESYRTERGGGVKGKIYAGEQRKVWERK